MGSFSWKAQDTRESIAVENPKSVYMLDNKGNKWKESNYQGYGVFGGKDFYQLVAEMNVEFYPHLKLTGDVDEDRNIGIDLSYGNKPYLSPNLYHDGTRKWKNEAPSDCEHQGYPPEDEIYW